MLKSKDMSEEQSDRIILMFATGVVFAAIAAARSYPCPCLFWLWKSSKAHSPIAIHSRGFSNRPYHEDYCRPHRALRLCRRLCPCFSAPGVSLLPAMPAASRTSFSFCRRLTPSFLCRQVYPLVLHLMIWPVAQCPSRASILWAWPAGAVMKPSLGSRLPN
jgi:hypothetical protein